jgi:hypothetical protein
VTLLPASLLTLGPTPAVPVSEWQAEQPSEVYSALPRATRAGVAVTGPSAVPVVVVCVDGVVVERAGGRRCGVVLAAVVADRVRADQQSEVSCSSVCLA